MTTDDASDSRPENEPGKDDKLTYDKPARPEEDTATDERRDKPIRGPEPWQPE